METPEPHEPLTPEQKARIESLTRDEIEDIDDALTKHLTERFRKAAMIIGLAMSDNPADDQIPDLYYFERLKRLVNHGLVELIGDPTNMRFCELRLRPVSEDANKK